MKYDLIEYMQYIVVLFVCGYDACMCATLTQDCESRTNNL